ncbi:MAG TPA: hypothetical protein VF551_04380 [Chthoniobacterales bacterium]
MSDLEVVDGRELSEEHRRLLRPGERIEDESGVAHHLPRFFFAVPSWPAAHDTRMAAHFKLAELMTVDCREASTLLHEFPHYVPCAIALLAGYLEAFRQAVGASVFVSANGGYKSPAHERRRAKDPHCWGTAADIYRVGDTYLDDEKSITRYADVAASLGRQLYVRPYSAGDDHLHIDLGFVSVTPRDRTES